MIKWMLAISISTLLFSTAFADDTWYPPNKRSFQWDAVTTMDDGNPVPETSIVRYRIYVKDEASGEETEGQEVDVELVAVLLLEGVVQKLACVEGSLEIAAGEV